MTERRESSHGPSSAKIVFVVEDDASMCRALSNLFESVGLQVEVFGSASEMLQGKLPDVASCLVLDVRLPGLSGLDFQTELAKANNTSTMMWTVTGRNLGRYYVTHGIDCVVSDPAPFLSLPGSATIGIWRREN